ncbi:hypothetical protein HYX19_00670 [Candidatus Woesearchaeota archaeon]|nr:hypothetical protein [Candidatus Woesearchaeota archaeon]
MNKKNYVKVCPNCGSTNITNDFSNAAKLKFGIELDKRCDSCGYSALSFPEVEESKIKDFKKKIKN